MQYLKCKTKPEEFEVFQYSGIADLEQLILFAGIHNVRSVWDNDNKCVSSVFINTIDGFELILDGNYVLRNHNGGNIQIYSSYEFNNRFEMIY